MIHDVVVAALVVVGSFFLTVGTIGLLRFPNVYNRMHATSKPTTLGTAAIFLAGFVRFGPGAEGMTSLVGIVFLFSTVPTGAHMIARAAERTGVPFLGGVTWPGESSPAIRKVRDRDLGADGGEKPRDEDRDGDVEGDSDAPK